jgi:hypothetical protein
MIVHHTLFHNYGAGQNVNVFEDHALRKLVGPGVSRVELTKCAGTEGAAHQFQGRLFPSGYYSSKSL